MPEPLAKQARKSLKLAEAGGEKNWGFCVGVMWAMYVAKVLRTECEQNLVVTPNRDSRYPDRSLAPFQPPASTS